jgi:hypothetical protein
MQVPILDAACVVVRIFHAQAVAFKSCIRVLRGACHIPPGTSAPVCLQMLHHDSIKTKFRTQFCRVPLPSQAARPFDTHHLCTVCRGSPSVAAARHVPPAIR